MELYFVRHGQSANNLMWSNTGTNDNRVSDPKLTEVGERQAALVAAFLAAPGTARNGADAQRADVQNVSGFPITHCYASLMERAVATGHRIATALDLPLLAWIDIHETGGMFLRNEETGENEPRPGLARSYLEQRYPRLIVPEAVTEQGWWNRPFEPEADRQVRAERVVKELLARHGDKDDGVVFVSHGGFFNHLLWALFGMADSGAKRLWFTANNVSVTRIDFVDGRRIVNYLNRVDFLPPDLVT